MRIEIDLPDSFRLAGLHYQLTAKGAVRWTCYLQNSSTLFLQGREADTPQEAIDNCLRAMQAEVRSVPEVVPGLSLDDIIL